MWNVCTICRGLLRLHDQQPTEHLMDYAIERQEVNRARSIGLLKYTTSIAHEYEIGLWWFTVLVSVRH
jgi:hypothetical protein